MMKRTSIFLLLLVSAAAVRAQGSASAADVRPVRDDVGFCWDHAQMGRLMKHLASIERESFEGKNLIGGISPHDDYLYAARVYHPLYTLIRGAKEAVIFGVTHKSVRQEIGEVKDVIILDRYKYWQSAGAPLEASPLREYLRERLDTSLCITSDRAHELEHSIEALLPFLAWRNPGIRITPVMVTAMTPERMEQVASRLASLIAAYMKERTLVAGRDIVFLISSDANHYGADFGNTPFGENAAAHRTGIENDLRIARDDLTGSITREKISRLSGEFRNVVWCGRYSIPFGLLTIQKIVKNAENLDISAKLLRYSDTYTEGVLPLKNSGMGTTAPFSLKHWVGFLSAGIYRGK